MLYLGPPKRITLPDEAEIKRRLMTINPDIHTAICTLFAAYAGRDMDSGELGTMLFDIRMQYISNLGNNAVTLAGATLWFNSNAERLIAALVDDATVLDEVRLLLPMLDADI